MKEIYKKIESDQAELIGEGPWIKDLAWLVYNVDGKFYAICMYDSMSCWLEESTLEEIKESEIESYIR